MEKGMIAAGLMGMLLSGCVNEYGQFRPPDPLGRALFNVINPPPKNMVAPGGSAYEGAEYVVTSPPPRARYEEIPVSRYPGQAWVQGHWRWNGNSWVWTPGHWERPPRMNAVWVAPQYYTTNGQRYWRTGYWQ